MFRDTLAENLAKKIFNESVKKHMTMFQSPLRNIIDPFTMFPLELPIKVVNERKENRSCMSLCTEIKITKLNKIRDLFKCQSQDLYNQILN